MELSKAPRLTPFTAWGRSCVGTSVLEGGRGAAAGRGGGGGGGGTVEIPVEEKGQSASSPHTLHTCSCSVLGSMDFGETAFFLRGTKYPVLYDFLSTEQES